MPSAGPLQRSVAVFVDFLVYFAVWVVSGIGFRNAGFPVAMAFLFVVDVLLTAEFGRSVGRWVAGVRVVRMNDAAAERLGIPTALIRTAMTFLTGWAGFLVFVFLAQFHAAPARMWWDATAGTRLVSTRGASSL